MLVIDNIQSSTVSHAPSAFYYQTEFCDVHEGKTESMTSSGAPALGGYYACDVVTYYDWL